MKKQTKEILILISLFVMCLSIWFFILYNLRQVAKEFDENYTGIVKYAWRWEKLPINVYIDPALKIDAEELRIIAAHFNYFFQSRYHSDIIYFVKDLPLENGAYLTVESHLPENIDAYTIEKGEKKRPSIYLKSHYSNWTRSKRIGVLMHELGHLVGLPHFDAEGSLMKEIQKSPPNHISEVEQELIYMLYSQKLASKIIHP